MVLLASTVASEASSTNFRASSSTGTVRSPSVSLQGGTAGTSTISSVEADAGTAKVTAGLTYYETANMPVSCGSPTVDTSLTAPGGTGSFTITNGQTACLWTPAYSSSASIPSGTTVLDAWASSGISAPMDQTTGASGGTTTTPTCAYGSNVAAGALLVVAFLVSPSSITVSSPTDSQSDTWSQVVTKSGGSTITFATYIYAAVAGSSAADTITLHFTGTVTDSYVTCFEVLGALKSTDTTTSGAGTATSGTSFSASVGSYTCTGNDFCYAFTGYQPCGASSAPTYDPAFTSMSARGGDFTGATNCRTTGGGTAYRFNAADEYKLPSSSASQTSTFSLGYGTNINTGTWGWAEVVAVFKPATTTLSVSEYTTNSAGAHQDTLISSVTTGTITSTKTEVSSSFSSSAGTVPAGGYIETTVTASQSVTIFWGSGQLTNFQTPSLFNYVLKIHNAVASSWTINLRAITGSNVNIGRLTNLTISFASPYSQQIIVASGTMTGSSGSTITLASSGDVNIKVGAFASSIGTSTLVLSLKVLSSTATPYSQYTIDVEVD